MADAAKEVFGRPLRVKFAADDAGAPAAPGGGAPWARRPTRRRQQRRPSHRPRAGQPEVQRFREVFGGEIRKVRNSRSSHVKLPRQHAADAADDGAQAQQVQEKLQQEVAQIRVEASPAAAWLRCKWSGQKNLLKVKIDPEVGATSRCYRIWWWPPCNEAVKKVDGEVQQKMGGMAPRKWVCPRGLF